MNPLSETVSLTGDSAAQTEEGAKGGVDGPRPDARVTVAVEARVAALDELVARHGAAVRRLAALFAADDREDLTQDIWLAVWRAWRGFRGECSERTFVMRIAHNRAVTHLCSRRRYEHVPLDDDLMSSAPGPERAVASMQQAERLMAGLRACPIVARQVMSLSLEGVPQREIAEILGISESNVGVRMHRARAQLRNWMEE